MDYKFLGHLWVVLGHVWAALGLFWVYGGLLGKFLIFRPPSMGQRNLFLRDSCVKKNLDMILFLFVEGLCLVQDWCVGCYR